MLIDLPNDRTAWLIGDPHMGREFKAGVPIDRRGERERMQRELLEQELAKDVNVNVTVGDLFDSPFISFGDLMWVIAAYKRAARNRPMTSFIIYPGNHCLSRQPGVQGAFHLFSEAMEGVPNIQICWRVTHTGDMTIVPWSWTETAAQQLEGIRSVHPVVLGHWDLESFGGDDSHLCPTAALVERGAQRIYTGHWHMPGDYEVDGVTVVCTGSLMPYGHAEDPDGDLYVTLTADELADIDPATLREKCVRLLLAPGETPPADLDCLALTVKRADAEGGANEVEAVSLDGFDWQQTIDAELEGVDPAVDRYIRDRLRV